MAVNNFEEVLRILIKTDGGKDIADLAQKIVALGGDSEEARSKVAELISQITSSQQAQRAIETFRQLGASVLDYEKQISAAREKVATLGKAISETDAPTKRQQAAFEAARKSLAKLEATQEKQRTQLNAARSIIEANGLSVTKLGTAESVLAERVDKARAAVGKMASEAERSAAAHKRLNSIVGSVRGTVQGWYGDLGRLLSRLGRISGITTLVAGSLSALGAIRIFGSALGSAKDFEQAITEVGAVSDASAEQLARLKQAAQTAGQQYGFTASQVAEALNQLARATGDADQSIGALPAVLALAKAGAVDLGQSTQFVVQLLNQFGLSVAHASEVADVLTKTSNDTVASVQSVGEAMSYAAPIAQQLHFGIKDLAAAVGELAQQGFDGTRAGTALRRALIDMLNPSSQFSAQLRALNIDTSTFASTIDGLAAAGSAGTTAILSLGQRAAPAITALVNNGRAGLKQLQQSLADAGGEADRTASKFSNTFQGSVNRLYTSFDNLRRGILDGALVPLKNYFNEAAKSIQAFIGTADFTKLQQSVTGFVKEAIAGFKQFIASINFSDATARIDSFLASSGKKLHDFFAGLGDTAAKVSIAFKTIGAAIDGVKFAVFAIGAAFTAVIQKAARVVGVFAVMTDQLGLTKGKAEELRTTIGGLGAVTDEFSKRMKDAGRSIAHAYDDATVSAKKQAQATQALGTFSDIATQAFKRYTAAQQAAAQATDKTSAAQKSAAEQAKALSDAFTGLGIKSQADLGRLADDAEKSLNRVYSAFQQGQATLGDVSNAFDAYKAKVLASVAGSTEEIQKQTQAMLDDKQAALGLVDTAASIGPAFAGGARQGAAALQGLGDSIQSTVDAASRLGDSMSQFKRRGEDALGSIAQYAADTRAQFVAISDAAAKAFDAKQLAAFNAEFDSTGAGFSRALNSITDAARQVNDELAGNRQQLAEMVDQINQVGATSSTNFGQFGNDAAGASAQMQTLSEAIKNGNYSMGLLGQQDLAPLQQALDAARQRVDAIAAAATAANQRLQEMAQQVHDQLLTAQGDQVQLEAERHQQALANLENEAKTAGKLNSQTYAKAVSDENQLHQLKLADIAQQQQAQQQSGAGSAPRPSTAAPTTPNLPSAGSGATAVPVAQPSAGGGATHYVVIKADGLASGAIPTDATGTQRLIDFVNQLQRARLLSTH